MVEAAGPGGLGRACGATGWRPGWAWQGGEMAEATTKQGHPGWDAPVSWSSRGGRPQGQLLLLTSSGVEPVVKWLATMLPVGAPVTAEEPALLLFRTTLPGVA